MYMEVVTGRQYLSNLQRALLDTQVSTSSILNLQAPTNPSTFKSIQPHSETLYPWNRKPLRHDMSNSWLYPSSCPYCGDTVQRQIFPHNVNGNRSRPYVECINLSCKKRLTFTDRRGLRNSNPRCYCGRRSRLQINGRESQCRRGLHYICAYGQCHFWQMRTDRYGSIDWFSENEDQEARHIGDVDMALIRALRYI